MANSPRVKFNLGATYDVELPSLPFNAFLQADVSYQSGVNFDLNQNPLLKQDSYAIVNASLGIEGKEGQGFRIALFVNNIFNVHYASALGVASGGTADLIAQTYSRNARRYGGVRARYSF